MPFGELLFTCAICEREIWDIPRPNHRDALIAPVCGYCERTYTERRGRPKAGAFMDRRVALRIYALAEALHSKAATMEWNSKHGR